MTTRDERRGQTIAIFAIFLVVLLGSTALAVDYGTWLKVRRDYQNVADAAALAGSALLTRPIDGTKQAQARTAAWKSVEDQLGISLDEATLGGSNGTTTNAGWRIWVSTPPVGGPNGYPGVYTGSNRVVYVWLERDNEAYFSRVFGMGSRVVSAWATAGTFPNRFAVITLRKNGMATNGNPTDLDVNGGTVLNVFDGDVGGNWGLSVNGVGSAIVMHSSTGDPYGVYLNENVPTGGNGWTPSQIRDGSGNPVGVVFNAEVADPNYPAPCLTYGVGTGNGCLEDRAVGAFPPNATTNRTGDTCAYDTTTNVDRLPAGHYHNLRVPNGKCVVLDPTYLPVAGKENGIYYFTGTLNMDNSSLVIGDGVTIVFDRNADMDMNAGATMSLNSGNTTNNPLAAACGGVSGGGLTTCKFSAWTARAGSGGHYSWSLGTSPTYATPPVDPFERGIAVYVCKSAGAANCGTGGGPSTDIFQANSSSGIDYRGLVYAPFDNVKLAGQPNHQDVGQLVAWTAMFTGGTAINQTFDGPDSGTPQLLEPRLGQ